MVLRSIEGGGSPWQMFRTLSGQAGS
jgi:hypothetical protein